MEWNGMGLGRYVGFGSGGKRERERYVEYVVER